jgi:tRNA-(ms[2]io[6]A)-hydroxylase
LTSPAAAAGLHSKTSPAWARFVLEDPVRLLDDHAHLERKAAQNALDLLGRDPERWAAPLGRVARDEVEHLARVVHLLETRGGRMSRTHANPYASALRRLVRAGAGPQETVDRLLVSALIEARSCERFHALAAVAGDAVLARLYRGLLASEDGHHRLFLDLARGVPGARAVDARWERLLAEEARILDAQPPRVALHGGEPCRGT